MARVGFPPRGDFSFITDISSRRGLRAAYAGVMSVPGGWEALQTNDSPLLPQISRAMFEYYNAVRTRDMIDFHDFERWLVGQLKGIERVGWEHFVQIWLDKQVDEAARAAGRAPNIFRGPAVRTALNRPGAGANADNMCPICFDKLERDIVVIDDGTILGRPVVCGHKFHKDCIQRWMNGKAAPTCPVCRGSIKYVRPWLSGGASRRNKRRKNVSRKQRRH